MLLKSFYAKELSLYQEFSNQCFSMQIPLVAMRIQNELFLIEKINGLEYTLLASFLQGKLSKSQEQQGITKEELKQLLTLIESDREKECIRYTVFKAAGLSQTKARQQFGLENMTLYERSACISEAKEIKSAISELAMLQDQAILDCYCGGASPEPEQLACLSESDTESDIAEEESLSSCESGCESVRSINELPDEL